MNVISVFVLGAGGILYPGEADFPEEYSGRLCSAQEALARRSSEILTMCLIAENLVNDWDVIKDEFPKTKTLADKRLLIAMMYQPWELCDHTFTEWSVVNKITLLAKNTLRTVPAKYLYSD